MNDPKICRVIGLPVAATSYQEAADWSIARASSGDRAWAVSAANTHLASHARKNSDYGAGMEKFDLICPDGMPLVWSVNAQLPKGQKLADRVYGPSLMLEVLNATKEKPEHSHFFLGGQESTLTKLQERFADNEIAGTYSPPFGEWPSGENERIIEMIRDSGAKYVWVGLGCPKQETWIANHLGQLPPAVYYGIGAAFAFHAGEVSQAPPIFQKIGMEWLYRLCAEPRRLWKRYAVYNSLFIYYTLKDRISD